MLKKISPKSLYWQKLTVEDRRVVINAIVDGSPGVIKEILKPFYNSLPKESRIFLRKHLKEPITPILNV